VAVRVAGAAYLVFLGAQTLVRALRGDGRTHRPAPRGSALRQGLLSNLGNPKMAVFFTSLLPQFAHTFGGLLVLGLVFSTMTLAWLSAYAVAVARAGTILRRGAIRRAIDVVTGAVLVAFGVRLASER
jgi:threonine/homoserine/homoserine lactone efflux protein